MKQIVLVIGCWLLITGSFAQTVSQKLQKAFSTFEKDNQLKYATSSFYVIDAQTGQVVFDKNSRVGLAPASTQKIITGVTAFELLGKNYNYKTSFGYTGEIIDGTLKGNLLITGTGDPTFGSWRYQSSKPEVVFKEINDGLQRSGIKKIKGNFLITAENKDDSLFVPDGWIWQDIGNYYGAGSHGFNWNENQYDLILKPGKHINDPVSIDSTFPAFNIKKDNNSLKTAAKNSGDNGYIYPDAGDSYLNYNGTIPMGYDQFIISGSLQQPDLVFKNLLIKNLSENGILNNTTSLASNGNSKFQKKLFQHLSPSLDSIIYWLNKKSINLYAEALIKTLAYEKKGLGSTDSGVVVIKDFWKQQGMDENELNMVDGSGLSPLNRVTTHAQVEILKYAKSKDWFPWFYNSLPEYNSMTMKSGTIRDVKGFCGYQKAKNGKEYIFSFLVNNYNGLPSALVNKMYKVLDVLK